MVIVVMGVSGSGKTAGGSQLAAASSVAPSGNGLRTAVTWCWRARRSEDGIETRSAAIVESILAGFHLAGPPASTT